MLHTTTTLVSLLVLLLFVPVAAQPRPQRVAPSDILNVPAAEIRITPNVGDAPDVGDVPAPVPDDGQIPFRPTMDPDEYQRLKADAEQQLLNPQPAPGENSPVSPWVLAPPVPDVNFEGLNQTEAGNLIPPDTHGAIGGGQFVEVVNSRLVVFDTQGTRLKDVSLASFFGYTARTLNDPRVVYDRDEDRWIVTALAFPESPDVALYFLAVSQTGDATGAFFVYRLNVAFISGDVWDFPQVGLDQNAVVLTANVFIGGFLFRWADLVALPKVLIYNGSDFSVPVFQGLRGTLTPPIVLDDNPKTYILNNAPSSPVIFLYVLENSGDPDNITVSLLPPVTVGVYTIPPSARQPGTSARLDTLDTRFVNASTQNGSSLFNVHTISVDGLPTPRWYEIEPNETGGRVVQSGIFFGAADSDDWNASLAVNDSNDVFVTWSSSRVADRVQPGYFPQIRGSGRRSTDEPGVIESGAALFESPTFLTQFRWGDYSAVTIDPVAPDCAWGTNEKVNSGFVWGSRVFRLCFQ